MAASSKITLAEVRQHDHGVLYGERTMGHTLAYFGTAQRPIELCPARLAKELQLSSCTDLWEDLATLTLLLVTFLQEDTR